MSDQQDEQKYGLEGIEQSQGYTPLVHAVPDEPAEPAIDPDSTLARHLQRPELPPPVHRDYFDVQTGEATPDNRTLKVERAASDIASAREQERLEVQRAANEALNRELDDATATLDAIKAAEAPQPVEQEPPPVDELQPEQQAFQPQPEAVTSGLDPEIAAAIQSPKVRNLLEQASLQVEQAKVGYQQATEQLAIEAQGVMTALFPELVGLSGQQAQGALAAMQQREPQRFEQFRQLAGRAQQLIGVYQAQQAEQRQQFAQQVAKQQQQHAQWLRLYETAEIRKYEEAIARDRSPEQIKSLRENVMPYVEKHYGIPEQQMRALYSGEEYADAATFMRSAPFQLMLSDALSYRMSKEAVGRAVSRPIPNVQRPGSSGEAQTRTEVALAEAQSKLKPAMSAKEAAAYVIARRAASR
jgi:hypothetical protein